MIDTEYNRTSVNQELQQIGIKLTDSHLIPIRVTSRIELYLFLVTLRIRDLGWMTRWIQNDRRN